MLTHLAALKNLPDLGDLKSRTAILSRRLEEVHFIRGILEVSPTLRRPCVGCVIVVAVHYVGYTLVEG